MKRFIAVALLASFAMLAFVDTAEARRCRRRSNCCQTACCQTQNACQSGAMQDPQAMNQYGQPMNQYGQQGNQYGQPTPATTFYRGDAAGQAPMPPAPQSFNTQGGAQGSISTQNGAAQGSINTRSGSLQGSANTQGSAQGSANTNQQ